MLSQWNKGSFSLRKEKILIESKHWAHYGLWTQILFLLYLFPIGGQRKHNWETWFNGGGDTVGADWRSSRSFAHFNHTRVHACSYKSTTTPYVLLLRILGMLHSPGLLIIPHPKHQSFIYTFIHSPCVYACGLGWSGEQWLTDRSEGALRYCSPSGHGREERITVHHIWSETVRFQHWITVPVGSLVPLSICKGIM